MADGMASDSKYVLGADRPGEPAAAFIDTVTEAQAQDLVAEQYRSARENFGYVPNYTKAFSLRPEAYSAWTNLARTVSGAMDLRRYELATIAAALALRSSYCSLAHGKTLSSKVFDPATVTAIARDFRSAGLPASEVALMEFAQKVTLRPHSITADDIDALRRHGFSDTDILDIVLAASARNFFSRVLDSVGALPDAAYEELEPEMRDALTVGRPIATEELAE